MIVTADSFEAFAPFRLLSANDRAHWRARARNVRTWRQWAHITGHQFRHQTGWAPVPCTVTVELPVRDRRRRDPANYHATLKPIVDGLVDAGIWPDDNPTWVTVAEPVLIVRPERIVRVLLTPRTDGEATA